MQISKQKFRVMLKSYNAKNPGDRLTQKGLAAELGKNETTFSRWMVGKTKGGPSVAEVREISRRLGCRPEDLLDGDLLGEAYLSSVTEEASEETQAEEGEEMLRVIDVVREMLRPISTALEQLSRRTDENNQKINNVIENYGPHLREFHRDLVSLRVTMAGLEKRMTALEQQGAWRGAHKDRRTAPEGGG